MNIYYSYIDAEKISEHEAAYKTLERVLETEYGLIGAKIKKEPSGKPYVTDSDLSVSVSHSRGLVICAAAYSDLGIDAELITRKNHDKVAGRMFSEGELARYFASDDKQAYFYKLWTLKESFAKATGKGLGSYLKNISFDISDAGKITCSHEGYNFSQTVLNGEYVVSCCVAEKCLKDISIKLIKFSI